MSNKTVIGLDNSLKLLVKSSMIILISIILAKFLGYLHRIIIARYLGPETYGLFSIAIMVLGFFVALSSLGLTDGILRFIPLYRGKKETKKINYILKFTIIILAISSVIFALLLFLSSEFISINIFHNKSLVVYLKIFSFLLPISIFANLFLSVLRAYEETKFSSIIQNIVQNFIKLLFFIIFIYFGFKTSGVIFSFFLGTFAMLVASYLVCKYKIPELFLKSKISTVQKKQITNNLFSYSWPIIIIGTIGNIMYWIDSFSIGYLKSAVDVGFYNAAVPIAMLFAIASDIFAQLFFPLITREYSANNLKLIKELTKQISKWIFIINLPLFLIILLFPGTIINVLFGSEYLVAENALRILAIGSFFLSISVVSTHLLSMIGKSKFMLYNLLAFSVINLLLNIALVNLYGINGAAFSTMLCTILSGSVFVYQAYKYLKVIPFKKNMLKIFFISIIPLLIVVILRYFIPLNLLSLALIGFLFVTLYFLLIYFAGCLDENDKIVLKAVYRKIFAIF